MKDPFQWYKIIFASLILFNSCKPANQKNNSGSELQDDVYDFNETISENVLRNYLARSITMAELVNMEGFYTDGPYKCKEDDFRMMENIKPKFVGRTLFLWGNEDKLNHSEFLQGAQNVSEKLHNMDKEIILQACIFEIVTTQVENIPVPDWVFKAFDLPEEKRNFEYKKMLNSQQKFVDHWNAGASVPDISRQETKMWFYFLAKNYIDIGMEALHFGQVDLMAMTNDGYKHWENLLNQIREYAKTNARRDMVLCDAHVPFGGMKVGNRLLLDFHSFPIRAKEVPEEPMTTILEKDHLDSFFGRSKGGITPSGWETSNLPYLVELDNFGISDTPGVANLENTEMWGYDEITWFALQPEKYRNEWLVYAYDWVRKADPNGYFQLPGSRKIVPSNNSEPKRYHANQQSASCPVGYGQESTIKDIWNSL